MTAFLNAGDLSHFSISVHAMKSMLAAIGAVVLSELALKLETASKKKEYNYCVEHFPRLNQELLSLHGRLSVIFPDEKDDSVKESGDTAYLQENVAKALAAADDFNGDSGLEAIHNLLAYDFGDETNVLLHNAMAAFKDYDFDQAFQSLKAVESLKSVK
jgi:HPt (histidine-containing phosphotransfer) domain-containing protein